MLKIDIEYLPSPAAALAPVSAGTRPYAKQPSQHQQLLKFKLYVGSSQLVIVSRVVKYTATLQPPPL